MLAAASSLVHRRIMDRFALACVVVAVVGQSVVHAQPVLRFGLTSGADANAPEASEAGPMVAVGAGAGRFVGEVNYTYLSFFDPSTSIHRAGVALRADLATWGSDRYWKAIYGELGAAKRWGEWRVNEALNATATQQNEVHAAIGYQLDRKWQLALRLGASRAHPMLGTACRGVACPIVMAPTSAGLAGSVMLEWMFVLGR